MKASNGWPTVKLGEHVELLTGFPFKSQRFSTDPNDTPLVKGENVAQGRIEWEISKRWPANELDQFEQYRLRSGDVVLAMDRPWIEAGLKYAWIKPHNPVALLVQRVSRLRGRQTLDQTFLRYIIGSPAFTDYIRPIVTGVNVPHISPQQIKDFQFRLPPVPFQRKAAAILSAYDDLIENNTRHIQVLERMAQALYREWFVNFRFPGHAKVKRVASPLGPIPLGWEVVRFEDIYRTSSGGTPSRKVAEYYGGDTNWVKTQELHDCFIFETDEQISALGLQNSSAKVFPANTVLIAMYGATIGQLGILAQPAATNQACCAVLPKIPGFGHAFAFLTLLVRRTDLINLRQGAAQQNVSQVVIKGFAVLKPPAEIVNLFNELVESKLDMIRNLQRKNQILRRTRDLLLPKLISGALDVSKLDIEAASTMP